MTCSHGTTPDGMPFVLTVGGPEHTIEVDGKDYRFEMHSRFGSMPLNKRGDPKELGPRHKFWIAVTCWAQQGRRIGEDGKCIWGPEPDPTTGFIKVGRNWLSPKVYESVFGNPPPKSGAPDA